MFRSRSRGSTPMFAQQVYTKRSAAEGGYGSTRRIVSIVRQQMCWDPAGRPAKEGADPSTSACSLGVPVLEILPRLLHELRRGERQVSFYPEHRALATREAACAARARHPRHLRQRNPEDVLAGPVERDAELLVFRRAEDVGMGAAELLQWARIGMLRLRVHRVAAIQGKRVRARHRVPEVLEPDRGLRVSGSP